MWSRPIQANKPCAGAVDGMDAVSNRGRFAGRDRAHDLPRAICLAAVGQVIGGPCPGKVGGGEWDMPTSLLEDLSYAPAVTLRGS